MTKNEVDIQEEMKDKWEIHTSIIDGQYTKTTQFMLHSIDLSISTLVIKNFVNAFIDDAEHDHEYICPLFMLFKVPIKKEWNIIYEQLTNNGNYIADYNCGQKNGQDLVMIVFSVPEKYRMDYKYFRLGKYSRFSDDYKKKFPRFVPSQQKKEESVVWQVITKSEDLKRKLEIEYGLPEMLLDEQDDIWDKPRKETEIYNYQKKETYAKRD